MVLTRKNIFETILNNRTIVSLINKLENETDEDVYDALKTKFWLAVNKVCDEIYYDKYHNTQDVPDWASDFLLWLYENGFNVLSKYNEKHLDEFVSYVENNIAYEEN